MLSLFVSSLAAEHRPSSISSLVFNDSVTLGLSDNPDDLRSYGMQILFHHESGWEVYSSIFGLTFRDRESQEGKRYDEFILQGGRLFHFHIGDGEPDMMIDLAPYVGVTMAGNLGLDHAQNLVHEVLDITLVDLPYEGDNLRVSPHVGSMAAFVYKEKAPWFSSSDLIFRAEVELSHALSYKSSVSTHISVGQSTSSVSDFAVGLGYVWAHVYDDWFTHEMVTMSETGVIGLLRWHFGVISFTYQWYLERLQGYGGLGFDIDLGENIRWQRNDVVLSMGMTIPERMTATSLRYKIIDELSLSITNMFKMVPLSSDERTREIVSIWTLGGDYEFSRLSLGWMRPFVSSALGLKRVLVMEDDTDSVIDSNGRVRSFSAIKFLADVQAGLRFFTDGRLQYQGVAYGLEISAGLQYGSTKAIQVFGVYDLEMVEVWRPYVKVAITAGSHL
jgi:hypothetical protein